MRHWLRHCDPSFSAIALVAGLFLVGCERKEKVLDIETPAGDVEIEKSRDGMEIDVENRRKDSGGVRIRIETDKND